MNDAKVILSDEEIICTWMEPKPTRNGAELDDDAREGIIACTVMGEACNASGLGWWRWVCRYEHGDVPELTTRPLDLDALWEVEERIKRMPLGARSPYYNYGHRLAITTNGDTWHADARQKIAALAHVLRPIVEASNAT